MDEAGKRKSSYGAVGIGTVKFDPLPGQIAGTGGKLNNIKDLIFYNFFLNFCNELNNTREFRIFLII